MCGEMKGDKGYTLAWGRSNEGGFVGEEERRGAWRGQEGGEARRGIS